MIVLNLAIRAAKFALGSPFTAAPNAFARTSGSAPGAQPSMRAALTGAPDGSTTMKVPACRSDSHLSTARPNSSRALANETAPEYVTRISFAIYGASSNSIVIDLLFASQSAQQA